MWKTPDKYKQPDCMLELKYVSHDTIVVEDQSSKDILSKGFFGVQSKHELRLSLNEALYLVDVRNAACLRKGSQMSFNELASGHWSSKKFIAKYFTYKDWRERGLIAKAIDSEYKEPNKNPTKAYPGSSIKLPAYTVSGTFYKADLTTILDDKEKGRELYDSLWLGQYGSYKTADHGTLNKLDLYETIFLIEKKVLKLDNMDKSGLMRYVRSRRSDYLKLYDVYKDWREKGYIIKTGFKFGTHFRVYFPGARPMGRENQGWVHSKHVIHVFPKETTLLISEWARAIRVAHSVRKTFILAVPGKTKEKKVEIDFILYHRKKGDADNPGNSAPRYAMLSLSEEEHIGGAELASAIGIARGMKMELVIAIADRETAVTYYKVRQIKLPGSDAEYYEIDWMQP